jgi:hypothetical protein
MDWDTPIGRNLYCRSVQAKQQTNENSINEKIMQNVNLSYQTIEKSYQNLKKLSETPLSSSLMVIDPSYPLRPNLKQFIPLYQQSSDHIVRSGISSAGAKAELSLLAGLLGCDAKTSSSNNTFRMSLFVDEDDLFDTNRSSNSIKTSIIDGRADSKSLDQYMKDLGLDYKIENRKIQRNENKTGDYDDLLTLMDSVK